MFDVPDGIKVSQLRHCFVVDDGRAFLTANTWFAHDRKFRVETITVSFADDQTGRCFPPVLLILRGLRLFLIRMRNR